MHVYEPMQTIPTWSVITLCVGMHGGKAGARYQSLLVVSWVLTPPDTAVHPLPPQCTGCCTLQVCNVWGGDCSRG
jgi:hypothetical protein